MAGIVEETEYIVGEVVNSPQPDNVSTPTLEVIWDDDKIERVSSVSFTSLNLVTHVTLLTIVSAIVTRLWMLTGSGIGNAFGVAVLSNTGMQQRLCSM